MASPDPSSLPLSPQDAIRRRQELLDKASRHLQEGLSALAEASALASASHPPQRSPRPNILDPLPVFVRPSPQGLPEPVAFSTVQAAGSDNPFLPASASGPKVNPFRLEFAEKDEVSPSTSSEIKPPGS